jgi:hypothetical protein
MIPQADDVARIIDIPLAIAQGANAAADISNRYKFDRRQALYYMQAAELLGLVVRRGPKFSLTALGHRYIKLTQPQRKELVVRRILSLPIVQTILQELLISPIHRVTRNQIEHFAASRSGISGTTVARRVQSLFSWFVWLGEETNVFTVSKEAVALREYSTYRNRRVD